MEGRAIIGKFANTGQSTSDFFFFSVLFTPCAGEENHHHGDSHHKPAPAQPAGISTQFRLVWSCFSTVILDVPHLTLFVPYHSTSVPYLTDTSSTYIPYLWYPSLSFLPHGQVPALAFPSPCWILVWSRCCWLQVLTLQKSQVRPLCPSAKASKQQASGSQQLWVFFVFFFLFLTTHPPPPRILKPAPPSFTNASCSLVIRS